MSEYTSYQRQDAFSTELSTKVEAADLTLSLEDAPGFTLGAGESVWGVIDPDGSGREGVEVTGIAGSVVTVTRAAPSYKGETFTAIEHAGGVKFILSDNWQNFSDAATAIASKLDKDGGNLEDSFALETQTSGVKMEDNAGELEFTSSTTATKTLAQLAALSGSDEKVKVSIADTTQSYLDDAVAVGTGITKTITDPAADETLTIAADLADQAEAEAGTDNTVLMTPLRTEQHEAGIYTGAGDIVYGTGAKARAIVSPSATGQMPVFDGTDIVYSYPSAANANLLHFDASHVSHTSSVWTTKYTTTIPAGALGINGGLKIILNKYDYNYSGSSQHGVRVTLDGNVLYSYELEDAQEPVLTFELDVFNNGSDSSQAIFTKYYRNLLSTNDETFVDSDLTTAAIDTSTEQTLNVELKAGSATYITSMEGVIIYYL